MEISGKIIAVLPLQSGQGKNGLWRSQDYVLETADQYPKKVCFNLFNDKIDKFTIALDDTVTISFDIESREYNGRWYTSIKAWNVKKEDTASANDKVSQPGISSFPPASSAPFAPSDEQDNLTDLPF